MPLNTRDLVSEGRSLTEDEKERKGQNNVFLPHFSDKPVHTQVEIHLVQVLRHFKVSIYMIK